MAVRASAREIAFGELELAFPYSEPMIEDLKSEIPARNRWRDPAEKVWRITGPYGEAAVDLFDGALSQRADPGFPRAPLPRRRSRESGRASRPALLYRGLAGTAARAGPVSQAAQRERRWPGTGRRS